MKKILYSILILTFLFFGIYKVAAMPNPWIDCGNDISCGAKKAGFNLPIKVDNYSVRAMDGMLEITFPLDKKRTVILRKAQICDEVPQNESGIKDISGVYIKYPVNKTIKLKNGVLFSVRGKKNKYYVANFAAETGYYSFYCKEGLTQKDLEYFYKLLENAEAPRRSFDDDKTLEQLQDSRRVDGIVEPVYTQDCFPRTLEKKGVTKNCFERANLGQDTACSLSEISMIKEYYKKGQDKDPLNDGSGQFCAE